MMPPKKPKKPQSIIAEQVLMPEWAEMSIKWKGDKAEFIHIEHWDLSDPFTRQAMGNTIKVMEQMQSMMEGAGMKARFDLKDGTFKIEISGPKNNILDAAIGELIANTKFADIKLKELIAIYGQFIVLKEMQKVE